MGGHARSTYYTEDGNGKVLKFERGKPSVVVANHLEVAALRAGNRAFYTHIFGEQKAGDLPSEAALTALATAMANSEYSDGNSDIPAGYTYLGQFIFHDISYVKPRKSEPDKADSCPKNLNSPALDLDSVLSNDGPFEAAAGCKDAGPLPLGCTSGGVVWPEDLPRIPMFFEAAGKPLIEDDRNDSFLPLAQCHLMMMKFFNAIAFYEGYDDKKGDAPRIGWNGVRKMWLQHFQSVVLHDYLPRVVDGSIYSDVMQNGRRIVRAGRFATTENWFPLEFAGAIGRFGHSMIRHSYEPWNRLLKGIETPVTTFMESSYKNSGNGLASTDHRLSMNWITNWYRLFDFSGTQYDAHATAPMMAGLINTNLTPALSCLPKCVLDEICTHYAIEDCTPFSSGTIVLADETLKRGREFGLASGQHALQVMNCMLPLPLPEIPADQIPGTDPGVAAAFTKHSELLDNTPLWFYILREAEHFACGRHLGPLGSRIVMETLHAAIEASSESILREPEWQPILPRVHNQYFSMPDLIAFTANPNPLGD